MHWFCLSGKAMRAFPVAESWIAALYSTENRKV
jgi:hypothetical protein